MTLTEGLLLFLVIEHTAMNVYHLIARLKHNKFQNDFNNAVRAFEKALILADLTWSNLSRKLDRKEK